LELLRQLGAVQASKNKKGAEKKEKKKNGAIG